MKDIKELIYAAVEENALKFQEIVSNQLQVRAYDAIEALRPEVGASMFGESSHKKMDDEDEEDMEDMEDEEDEDEDEDEKKSKVEEELKGNQHKIDKNKNGKIDGHDFKLLRKEDVEELDELSAELLQRTAKAASARSQAFKSERDSIAKMPHQQRDAPERAAKIKTYDKASNHYANLANKANVHKSNMADKLKAKSMQSKLPARMKNTSEEVEQIDEIGDTPKGREALTKLASHRFGRARWAAGVHRANSRSDSTAASPHSRLQDKDSEVGKKAADKAGIAHRDVPDHNYDYDKKGGVGTKVADPAYKLAARNKPKMEEVVNEVAMPKNAADWQALITHQIKTTGHPVATDAQFRAQHGKDKTKIASLEPGEDKLQYATAQGGTVKQ